MSSSHSVIGSDKKKIKYAKAMVATTAATPARISSLRDPLGRISTKHFYEDSCCRLLAHLAWAAFFAMADLSSGESFAARAFPPLLAPSFPSATAAGFFSSAIH